MRKKLVASGDSFTAGLTPKDKNGKMIIDIGGKSINPSFPLWPELLGEMLDMDVINLGLSGTGNEYIYNSLIDNLSTIDNIGLTVSCWSSHDRLDFNFPQACKTLRIDTNNFEHWLYTGWPERVKNKYKPVVDSMLEKNMVSSEYNFFKSLRWYHAYQNFCEVNNISYLQCSAILGGSGSANVKNNVKSMMLDHPIFYQIKEDNFIGWPIFNSLGGFNMDDKIGDNRVSEEDYHPNAKGHKIMADILYKHYKRNYD